MNRNSRKCGETTGFGWVAHIGMACPDREWPSLSEASQMKRIEPATDMLGELLWGPIAEADARDVGAHSPTATVLLRPALDQGIRARALAEIPVAMWSLPEDTASSLRDRIAASDFFEDSHVLKGGNGRGTGRRVRLNATTYPQPRRRSWSVTVKGPHVDEDGDVVQRLLNYTAAGRNPSDWRAARMPRSVFELGATLWNVVLLLLTPACQRHPPTGCQLLGYYTLFRGRIPRHRDNYTTQHMIDAVEGRATVASLLEGSHHGGDANSQMTGSNVLVWTEGDADMTFALSFFPDGDVTSNRQNYVIHPTFCCALGSGTLLVFNPTDDLNFCHEAYFEPGAQGCRFAFVFRWLTAERAFFVASDSMKLSPKLAEDEGKRKRARHAKRRRQNGLI